GRARRSCSQWVPARRALRALGRDDTGGAVASEHHPRRQLDAAPRSRHLVEGRAVFLVQDVVEGDAEAEAVVGAERAAEGEVERGVAGQPAQRAALVLDLEI